MPIIICIFNHGIFMHTLFEKSAKPLYLWIGSIILLFIMLGSREIWTQEHRWADIVDYMLYYNDYLHPVLNGNEYYDKPLLSYWIIILLTYITGELSTWTLRIPSACFGCLSIVSIYIIGSQLKDKRLGVFAGWMLLTTFYFMFWARIASTDILNLGGTLFAIAWYFLKRDRPSFINYSIFYIIIAITALLKGLIAPAVVFIAVMMDLIISKSLKKHLQSWQLYVALLPAIVIYLIPFWISAHYGSQDYRSDGLALVYRENILRYFHPFDHQDPIYCYLYYLPIYLLPWTFFFLPALFTLKYKNLSKGSLWTFLVTISLFVFFTLSGSRRGYYVLPIVPFAILLTADWILSQKNNVRIWATNTIIVFYIIFFSYNAFLLPWFYKTGGVVNFKEILNKEVSKIHPWSDWNFSLLDAQTKLTFYLKCRPNVKNYGIVGLRRDQTLETVKQTWTPLQSLPKNTIFVTRRLYEPILADIFKDYIVVEAEPTFLEKFFDKKDPEAPVAYVPKKFAI